MGDTNDNSTSNSTPRNAIPQAAWPLTTMIPPPPDYHSSQWAMWSAAAAAAAHWQQPAPYPHYMAFLQQNNPTIASAASSPSSNTSPRTKDEAVKLVKPKEAHGRHALPSPAGIQSPKPNSPGFLLGASRKEGFHAFSPYSPKSDSVSRSSSVAGKLGGGNEEVTDNSPGMPSYPHKIAIPRKINVVEQGIDLTISKSTKGLDEKSASAAEKKDDNKKSAIPVGIAVARQRTAATSVKSHSNMTKGDGKPVSSSSTAAATCPDTLVTSTVSNSTQSNTTPSLPTTLATPWASYPLPYVANPYQHFTAIAQPAMYMMSPRPMFPAHPSYFPVPSNSLVMPELTVKTAHTSVTAHASTSPSKPMSANSSPKSPLDKAREKLQEINQRYNMSYSNLSPPVKECKTSVTESERKSHSTSDKVDLPNGENKPIRKSKTEKPVDLQSSDAKEMQADKADKNAVKVDAPTKQHKKAKKSPSLSDNPLESQHTHKRDKLTNQKINNSSAENQRIKPKELLIMSEALSSANRSESPAAQKCGQTNETIISYGEESKPVAKSQPKLHELPDNQVKTKPRKPAQKRRQRSTDTHPTDKSSAVVAQSATSVDLDSKPFLWAEDAFEPVIVKHENTAYDLCQDDDLKSLETKLKQRMKNLQKQISEHKAILDGDIMDVMKKTEQNSSPQRKSSFSVRSDSHPSLKMKAAAKAKSRASQSDEDVKPDIKADVKVELKPDIKVHVPKESIKPEEIADKFKRPLTPLTLSIAEPFAVCRRLSKQELLTVDSVILTNIENLFYESRIQPIEPPDIFGVVIDGERHSTKPRIFTEEDLLNNTFTNVAPKHLDQLSIGTRVCGYWSELIGCLYPGTVTAIYPAKNSNSKPLIDIEFDDGDSGKFPLHQIRLLPPNYPHCIYDTSSVIPVGRRRSSAVPETPPIMISPPANRGRVSRSYSSPKSAPNQKKRVRPSSGRQPQPKKKAAAKQLSKGSSSSGSGSTSSSSSSSDSESSSDSDSSVNPGDEKNEDAISAKQEAEWQWLGSPIKKQARGKASKDFYDAITRDGETIKVGDCAVFTTLHSSSLPYIGEILSMWGGWGGKMRVSVKWFYHPQELKVTVKLPCNKGALFESAHSDENCVQTIKHKCQVVPYEQFVDQRHLLSSSRIFYLAGNYDAARCKVNRLYV